MESWQLAIVRPKVRMSSLHLRYAYPFASSDLSTGWSRKLPMTAETSGPIGRPWRPSRNCHFWRTLRMRAAAGTRHPHSCRSD